MEAVRIRFSIGFFPFTDGLVALRLVDNKAILYFDLPSSTEAMTWSRGKYRHMPACPLLTYPHSH